VNGAAIAVVIADNGHCAPLGAATSDDINTTQRNGFIAIIRTTRTDRFIATVAVHP